MNNNSTPCAENAAPKKQPAKTGDRTNYVSPDGAVTVVTKVNTAKRHPPHNYPIVCLQFRFKKGARRIQRLEGEDGLEALLTHPEVAGFLTALAEADPACADYRVPHVPAKSPERKQYWDRINAERCARGRHNQEQ